MSPDFAPTWSIQTVCPLSAWSERASPFPPLGTGGRSARAAVFFCTEGATHLPGPWQAHWLCPPTVVSGRGRSPSAADTGLSPASPPSRPAEARPGLPALDRFPGRQGDLSALVHLAPCLWGVLSPGGQAWGRQSGLTLGDPHSPQVSCQCVDRGWSPCVDRPPGGRHSVCRGALVSLGPWLCGRGCLPSSCVPVVQPVHKGPLRRQAHFAC